MERSVPAVSHPRAAPDTFSATWIGHSSTLLQVGGLNVLTDPVFCERASPLTWIGPARRSAPGIEIAALPPIDIVLVSHNHYDHLDRSAVSHLADANPETRWIVPLGLASLLRRWGIREVTELDWWETTEVGGMVITGTPSRHFSGRWLHDRNRTLWSGFALSIGGWRGFYAGDTAYHDEFAEVGSRLGPFDFVMIPIGAYEPRWFMRAVHVDPEEAVQIYRDLISSHPDRIPPLMLAIHWGTFRLTHEPMNEPPRRVREYWEGAGLDAARLWIARCGETRSVGGLGPV